MFWPALVEAHLDAVRVDVRLQAIVRAFLGDDVKQLNNQLYYRLPGDGDAFGWHSDRTFRKGLKKDHHINEDYLQTVIAIDEMTPDNGGLWFVPGSQNHKVRGVDRSRMREEPHIGNAVGDGDYEGTPTFYAAKAGDMLIWSTGILHASLCNRSEHPRMTYMNGFCRARSCEVWPWYLKAGKLVRAVDKETIPYA